VALWLNGLGLSAFVLRYRTTPYHHPYPMLDGQRAIRLVRARAREFGLDPGRIGMLGFSAGGHLVSTVGTHFGPGNPEAQESVEQVSSRPDALVLCYPVITFGTHRHDGSRTNLLGSENPPAALVKLLSNELQVTPQTPPAFLWHTANDEAVPVENSLLFAGALSRNQVPFELHVFADGRHGLNLAKKYPGPSLWTKACENWLEEIGFIK
jgi:acetyl esterase/lipase